MDFKSILNRINNNELKHYQFYNVDIRTDQYESIKHYLKNTEDNINNDQLLHILHIDIEIYTYNTGDIETNAANSPISSITIYSNLENVFHTYFLKLPFINITENDILNLEKQSINEFRQVDYIKSTDDIKIHIFTDELQLIQSCFDYIKEIDPVIITGWNCDAFDIPYIYFRLLKLLKSKEETASVLSKFGIIKTKNIRKIKNYYTEIIIPEIMIIDYMRLYMPRDEGGLNYGKKQPSYSLDWISNVELEKKKLEYKDDGTNLDKLYENNPLIYIKYNIIDVALTSAIDDKLKYIELHNLLRRDMKTTMSTSNIGQSGLFETYFYHELIKNNTKVRFGISEIDQLDITELDILDCPIPKNTSTKWTVKYIRNNTYKKFINRYSGAYIKDGYGAIVEKKDGIPIDMDAVSLYPSMISQHNISFDTYFGRIIDPVAYKLIKFLEKHIGNNIQIPKGIHESIFDKITENIKRISIKNKGNIKKNEWTQLIYYIIVNALNKLQKNNINIHDLFNPKNRDHLHILNLYLIPLIDMISMLSPDKEEEYNSFAYDYILNDNIKNTNNILVIENDKTPNIKIKKIETSNFKDYLIDNLLSINLSGALFYNHNKKEGISFKFLQDRIPMRNEYLKKMGEYQYGSPEYEFYNKRQKVMKTNANSLYGVTGMPEFIFSNKWLALSTTTSGRLTLKISQICGELYLRYIAENTKK